MTTEKFLLLFSNSFSLYLISFSLIFVCFIPLLRRYCISVISPEFINIIFLAFADAVPLYLYFIHKVDFDLFLYFITFELAFLIGLRIFKSDRLKYRHDFLIKDDDLAFILFLFFFFVWLIFSLINYKNEGLGINKTYRLENEKAISGPLKRFQYFSSEYLLVYTIHKLFRGKKKILCLFFIFVLSIQSILSGSKASILNVIFFFYLYLVYYQHNIKPISKIIKFIPLIAISPLIIYLSTGVSIYIAFSNYMLRFIAYGDPYWLSFPNRIIEKINYNYPFFQLFAGFLSPTKLFPSYLFEDYLGIQLNHILYPTMTHITGANARPPIFYFALFNWGGVFWGFLLGVIISFIVFNLYKKMCKGFITTFIYFEIFMMAFNAIVDPNAALSSLFTLFINIIIISVITLVVGKYKFKIEKSNIRIK